jgi:hypothetical protein
MRIGTSMMTESIFRSTVISTGTWMTADAESIRRSAEKDRGAAPRAGAAMTSSGPAKGRMI